MATKPNKQNKKNQYEIEIGATVENVCVCHWVEMDTIQHPETILCFAAFCTKVSYAHSWPIELNTIWIEHTNKFNFRRVDAMQSSSNSSNSALNLFHLKHIANLNIYAYERFYLFSRKYCFFFLSLSLHFLCVPFLNSIDCTPNFTTS